MRKVKQEESVVANVVNDEIMALLKVERKKRGWSYEELGKRLGVSASYMYRLEKGQRQNPSVKVLKSLCELFDIEPSRVMLMEPNLIQVGSVPVSLKVIQDSFDLLLNTDTQKTSEVISLLEHVKLMQDEFK